MRAETLGFNQGEEEENVGFANGWMADSLLKRNGCLMGPEKCFPSVTWGANHVVGHGHQTWSSFICTRLMIMTFTDDHATLPSLTINTHTRTHTHRVTVFITPDPFTTLYVLLYN